MAAQTYAYTALDATGARRSGVVEAEDQDSAVARLAAEGRFVLDIRASAVTGAPVTAAAHGRRGRRPSRQDLALFTRRLADLSRAGLPLDRALMVVAKQSESATLQAVAEAALDDVRTGLPVSQALAKHPRLFPDVYTQTLRAGETSGQFPQVAARLADMQEKDVARRSQIVSALIYPAILGFTALLVITFMLTFVLPRLSGVFNDLGGTLPLTTRVLLGTADFLSGHWLLVLVAIVVPVVALRASLRTLSGVEARDRYLLRAPLLGRVILKATVSRFARVLGTLVYGGVPMLEALELAGLAAGNRIFARSARTVAGEVREGRAMADAMGDETAFPPVLVHMVAIGEETGELAQMLERVSESLDFEVDTGVRRLVSLVEPVIVLTMGGFVGFVVLSVMLPIFQAQNLVK